MTEHASGNIDDLIVEMRQDDAFNETYMAETAKLDAAVALVNARDELHLSQAALAEKVGKPQSTIARIERGTTSPTVDTLAKLAGALGKQLKIEFV